MIFMNFQHLKYILEINRWGSISKAAKQLYITQPHLSKILHELESELHIIIFERTQNGVSLTYEGSEFLEYAIKIIGQVDRLEEIYHQRQKAMGKLNISGVRISHVVDSYIRALEKMPDTYMRFRYTEANSADVVDDVYNYAADIGVISTLRAQQSNALKTLENKNISYEYVGAMPMTLVVSKNHPLAQCKEPVSLDIIYKYGLVAYDAIDYSGLEKQSFLDIEHILDMDKVKKIIYINSRASLHNIVSRTNLICIGIGSTIEQDELFHIVSLPIKEQWAEDAQHNVGVIYLKGRPLSPNARLFIKTLKECYGAEVALRG